MNISNRVAFAIALLLLAAAIGLPQLMTVWDTLQGLMFGLAIGILFALLLRQRLSDSCDAAPAAVRRRYQREMAVSMAIYVVLILASFWSIRHFDLPTWARAVLALLPIVGIALWGRAQMRYLAGCDELQQKIELQAIAMASALLVFGSFPLGLLAAAKVFEIDGKVVLIWILPSFFILYGLAKVWAQRRYR